MNTKTQTENIKYALQRLDRALKYGNDMISSKNLAIRDAMALLIEYQKIEESK